MWPSGRGLVPYPAQSFTVYNPGGNPEIQNQQGTIYTTYANYPPYAPYSQQALPAHYSQQALLAPYSQQVSGVRFPQDLMAGDIVLRDQNWLLQNRYRRESMPEYKNGEVVMVRCNQQKWLYGIIQRMSAQGLRIWIADAQILVNVPLVLLPTHVLKMSTYSELQTLPQPEPMWTMAITDNEGCRKALVQCVRPAHLSHRQLFHKLGCIVCAICKTTVSSIDVVSPWNCSHQVHNHCLQLRMQHCSTSVCPSCDEIGTRQLMPLPSTGNGSTFQLMPSPSTNNTLTIPRNGQHQQWLDLQCACGFRGSTAGVGNMNASVFCPNCHQPVNVNPMTIGMQSGQPFASMNLPRAYSEVEREILQRTSVQDQGSGWSMQSFSGPSRLEAIEEGREGIPSTPPSPEQTSLDSLGTDGGREEPSYLPSYLFAFGETFENSNISDPNVVAVRPVGQNMQPSSSARSSWQDGLLYEPSGQSSARSSLQDGALTAPSPTRITLIQNGQSSSRSSSQDGLLYEPSGQSSARSSWQDGALTAPSPTQSTLIQNGQSSSRSLSQDGSLYAPSSTRITRIQNEQSRDNAPDTVELLIGPAASTYVNHVKLTEVEEADESSEKLETETTAVAATDRQTLWRRASEVDWTRGNIDEESEENEEASSSNNFAAIDPSTPPVYVNHFADFVKLAVAGASTAKEILSSASASASSSTTDPPPLKSPTPHWVTPAPAFVTPAPAFFTRAPALITEAPAIITPARAFYSRAPALITDAPAWVPVVKDPDGGDPSSAWITVIKDGVDSRKDDKRWEVDRLARAKEAEFL